MPNGWRGSSVGTPRFVNCMMQRAIGAPHQSEKSKNGRLELPQSGSGDRFIARARVRETASPLARI